MAAACISPAAKRHFWIPYLEENIWHDGRRHPKATARSRKQRKGEILQRFFKTGPGQYGEGDLFLGIPVPRLRKLCRECGTWLWVKWKLCSSPLFTKRGFWPCSSLSANTTGRRIREKEDLHSLLEKHSMDQQLGSCRSLCAQHCRRFLDREESKTSFTGLPFVRVVETADCDPRDFSLCQRAAVRRNTPNWRDSPRRQRGSHPESGRLMLREVGKRDRVVEEAFLKEHYRRMPRTMLRYAIERFPAVKKEIFMKGRI